MTASERLRALADHGDLNMPSDYIDRLDVITDALPLIADVVEAAERDMDYIAESWRVESFVIPETTNVLALALTALREHLEGGDE